MAKYLYLIVAENGLYKIGITSNPQERFLNMYRDCPVDIKIDHLIAPPDGADSLEIELHQKYDHVRFRGEWFALTKEMVKAIKELPNSTPIPKIIIDTKISRGNNGQVYITFLCPNCKRRTRAKRQDDGSYKFSCRTCGHQRDVIKTGDTYKLCDL